MWSLVFVIVVFLLLQIPRICFPAKKIQAPQFNLGGTTALLPSAQAPLEGWKAGALGSGLTNQNMCCPCQSSDSAWAMWPQTGMKQLLLVLPRGEEVNALTNWDWPNQDVRQVLSTITWHTEKSKGKAIRVEASAEGLNGFLWIH